MKKLSKKLISVAALALFTSVPAFAAANFTVDFEKTWDYSNGDVNNFYNGGAAADGSIGGPNLGVSFSNVSGLTNDDLGPYFSNAPSPMGIAYAHDTAYINVAAGVEGGLSFYYSSANAVVGAVTAYSGLNGTGTVVGTIDLAANGSGYSTWTPVTLNLTGTAQSFDLSASANGVGFDNISAVPEPESYALLIAGLGLVAGIARRNKRQAA